jgi:SAM-dependent methyltransferase
MEHNKLADHWNKTYEATETKKLGWYEETPEPSLTLIQECPIDKNDVIIDVGCGASTLVDELINNGYTNIVLADISKMALGITHNRLKTLQPKNPVSVAFLTDDVTNSKHIKSINNITVWHDRAVLHFLTNDDDQQAYLKLLKLTIRKGGYVIISTFAIGGAEECSGLPVKQYDAKSLSDFLGPEFKLVKSFDHTYTTTWGQERPFIYTVFQCK